MTAAGIRSRGIRLQRYVDCPQDVADWQGLVEGLGELKRRLEVAEERVLGILVGEIGMSGRNAPVNAERVIQNRDTSVRLRMVEIVALVLENRRLGKDGEAVGETPRNEGLQVIVFRKFHGHMPAVGRRAFADVESDVKHPAPDTAHKLALGKWRTLEMQPPHHTIRRHGLVVLAEINMAHFLVEFTLGKTLEKIASRIPEKTRLDDQHTLYLSLDYIHGLRKSQIKVPSGTNGSCTCSRNTSDSLLK